MRSLVLNQLPLVPTFDHRHCKDLAGIARVLSKLPEELLRAIDNDIRNGKRSDVGREGMAAEQVLRVVVLRKLTGMSYERLAFTLEDSLTYRAFCLLGPGDHAPRKATLHRNVKPLSSQTLEKINKHIVDLAIDAGVETGRCVAVDATAVETAIHHPTDSSLLLDCVNKLTRLLEQAAGLTGTVVRNHRKRAKRRALGVANAKSMKERRPLYRDLLRVVGFCLDYARKAITALENLTGPALVPAGALAQSLRHCVELATKVCDQAFRRVFLGEDLPPEEKVVSIHEPHTDIIVKSQRDPTYGHKVFLSIGRSGIVLDLSIPPGNPNDSRFTVTMIDRIKNKLGLTPSEVAFDGGFASHANFESLKASGVDAVAFTSPRGLSVEQMTGTRTRFERLRKFRARIEGTIGWLKGVFKMRRCSDSGFESFQAYSWASAITLNLLIVARRT